MKKDNSLILILIILFFIISVLIYLFILQHHRESIVKDINITFNKNKDITITKMGFCCKTKYDAINSYKEIYLHIKIYPQLLQLIYDDSCTIIDKAEKYNILSIDNKNSVIELKIQNTNHCWAKKELFR